MWKLHYSSASGQEKGTLYQLKTLINRASVPHSPDDNMKAAEDFLLVVLHAHAITAAETLLKDNNEDSVHQLSTKIVSKFVNIWKNSGNRSSDNESDETSDASSDGIFVYASSILTLGLLWMAFYDAIKEGNGEKVLIYWKFLSMVFRKTGRKNYSIEALQIQLQRNYLLSEREAAQLLWSRCINTHGRKGCNIPADLHMEHLNRRLKTILRHKGSNIQPSSVERAAKSIGTVHRVCQAFEDQIKNRNDRHPYPSFEKDLNIILEVLKEIDIFSIKPNRIHATFPMHQVLLENFDVKKFKVWAKTHILKNKLRIIPESLIN